MARRNTYVCTERPGTERHPLLHNGKESRWAPAPARHPPDTCPAPALTHPPSPPSPQLRGRAGAAGVALQPQHCRRRPGRARPPGAGHLGAQHLPRRAAAGAAGAGGRQRAPQRRRRRHHPAAGARGLAAAPQPLPRHRQPLQQTDLQADAQVRGRGRRARRAVPAPSSSSRLFSLPGSLLTPLSGRALIGASRAPPPRREPRSVSARRGAGTGPPWGCRASSRPPLTGAHPPAHPALSQCPATRCHLGVRPGVTLALLMLVPVPPVFVLVPPVNAPPQCPGQCRQCPSQ